MKFLLLLTAFHARAEIFTQSEILNTLQDNPNLVEFIDNNELTFNIAYDECDEVSNTRFSFDNSDPTNWQLSTQKSSSL